MQGENQERRMTAFRKANRRRMRIKQMIGMSICCICPAAVLAWVIHGSMDAGASQTQPQAQSVATVVLAETKDHVQVPLEQRPALYPIAGPEEQSGDSGQAYEGEYTYAGELDIAAYCGEENAFTYSGTSPKASHTAAGILSLFQIGDHVKIDGKFYVIEDKVEENGKEQMRIYFDDAAQARAYGRKTVSVYRCPQTPEMKQGYLGEFEVTGYCSCSLCCGKKEKKLTKMETEPKAGYTIAADPDVIALGSEIEVDGVVYLVEDTGKAIKGQRLDIYFDKHEEAVQYGRRKKYVYLQ